MASIKMEQLVEMEQAAGLEPDGLTYQQRVSRITAYNKGEQWVEPEPIKPKKNVEPGKPTLSRIQSHPLFGKKILITPLMYPDAKRNLAYDEELGPEITVSEFNAGEAISNRDEGTSQMFGDYVIKNIDRTKKVVAKTTFPKIGTEISYTIGKDLVPVVRGNDGNVGYIWKFPTQIIQVKDTCIQLMGLHTLIENVYPELLEKFRNKPMMSYIDGITEAASIPLTHALLKEQTRKELIDERAGINL